MTKNFGNALSNASMLASAIIGAGLIGGKELIYYFKGGIWSIILFAVLYIIITVFMLNKARQFDALELSTLSENLFGKASGVISFIFNTAYFIVVSVMLAGAQQCMTELLDIPLKFPVFSMLTALLCSLILCGGIERIKLYNKLAMIPTLLFVVTAYIMFGKQPPTVINNNIDTTIFNSLQYVGYNTALSLGVVCAIHSKDKKQNTLTSVLATLILGCVILMLMSFPLDQYSDKAMPILFAISNTKWLYIWGVVTVFIAVTTSVLSNAFVLTEDINSVANDRSFAVILVMTSATILSVVGIDALITNCYPLIAILCGFTVLMSLIKRRRIA